MSDNRAGNTKHSVRPEVLNGDAIAGNDGWRAMARQGSAMLLDAMLRYYDKHHPKENPSPKASPDNSSVDAIKIDGLKA